MLPYFLKRCDSMLAHINLVGRVHVYDIHEDDERVVKQLVLDNKIGFIQMGNDRYYASVGAKQYQPETSGPHPIAFHLASANPANEQFVAVYRKNWVVPALPEYQVPLDVETQLDTVE